MKELKEGIIVCSKEDKYRILENSRLKHYKFYDVDSFIEAITFKVKEEAIVYLNIEKEINCAIAKMYIDNLYFKDCFINDPKCNNLIDLYNDLNTKGFIYDEKLIDKIKLSSITLYNLEKDSKFSFIAKRLDNLNIKYEIVVEDKDIVGDYNKKCFEFKTSLDESRFIFNKIHELIDNGVSLDNIKIANYNSVYNQDFHRLSYFYKIPVNLPPVKNIISTDIAKYVLDNLNGINSFIELKLDYFENSPYHNTIINIINDAGLNKYNPSACKDYLIYKFRNAYYDIEKYEHAVELIDLYSYCPNKDDHIFIMSMNTNTLPEIKRDDEYLSDELLKKMGFETSQEINKRKKENLLNILKFNNLYLTYKNKSNFESFFPSNIIDDLSIEVVKMNYQYKVNQLEDELEFGLALDRYFKFGESGESNNNFENKVYDIGYYSYKNTSKAIDPEKIEKYKPFNLSASSLNDFYGCRFKFMLKNFLNLETTDDKYHANLGSVIHRFLELTKEGTKVDDIESIKTKAIDDVQKEEQAEFTDRQKFFMRLLLSRADDIREFNKQFYIDGVEVLTEQPKKIVIKDNVCNLVGFIDKQFIYRKDDEINYVIVDYKTGSDEPDLRNIDKGISSQLAIYVYFVTHDENNNLIKENKPVGVFLQNVNFRDDGLLKGYKNSDSNILDQMFNKIPDVEQFKSKKDGSLSAREFSVMNEIIGERIENAIKIILSGDFKIENKKIGSSFSSCSFCKFSAICHKDFDDIETLKGNKDIHLVLAKEVKENE